MSLDEWFTRTNGTPNQVGKRFQPSSSGGLKGASVTQSYKPSFETFGEPEPAYVAPKDARENRIKEYNKLYDKANALRRKVINGVQSFKPLRIMSEWELLNRKEPEEGVRMDVIGVPYVFDKNRLPSQEDMDKWRNYHFEAERFIYEAYDYMWDRPVPNNVEHDVNSLVMRGRDLRDQGLLSESENRVFEALRKFSINHPSLKGKWNESCTRLEPIYPSTYHKHRRW